jgi:hypothetical protein
MFDFSNYYYLIMGLQGFCVYHAYKNNDGQKWYWLIIFLPVLGSLIYLYDSFYSRRNMQNLTENIKGVVYSNHAVEKLEKAYRFSDTFINKVNLADAYTERQRLDEAIALYELCRKGIYEDNIELLQKLSNAYYLNKNYQKVIEIGNQSKPQGDGKINYAWALFMTGDLTKSENKFRELNKPFSDFRGRMALASFLVETNRSDEARQLLNGVIEEFDNMSNYEQSLKRKSMKEVKDLLKTIR